MSSLGIQHKYDDEEKWVKGNYYVRKLHPTLTFLMWNYGALEENQESEYVNAKMRMLTEDETITNLRVKMLLKCL